MNGAKEGSGPEQVVSLEDPGGARRAWLVIDSTRLGPALGGIRMLPDVDLNEVRHLARAMTYKMAFYGLPAGGAKAGIRSDPSDPGKREHLLWFLRSVRPHIASGRYVTGPDMGTSEAELHECMRAAGMEPGRSGILAENIPLDFGAEEQRSMPLDNYVTGLGVFSAATTALRSSGLRVKGARFAVEGFGKVGQGLAHALWKNGCELTAVSTLKGAIYSRDGIDIPLLHALASEHGDACIQRYLAERRDIHRIPLREVFTSDVDVVVPGARVHAIDEVTASRIQAGVVSPAANAPCTPEAERVLHERGILSIPDFVANAGAVVSGMVAIAGGTERDAISLTAAMIRDATRWCLKSSERRGISMRGTAVERAERTLRRGSRYANLTEAARALTARYVR